MSQRAFALPLIVLVIITGGCTAFGTTAAEVTVKNSESSRYQMTVYLFEEPVDAGNVTYQVTNSTGVRKTIGGLQLDTVGPYYNLSLGEEWKATERQLSIPANETRTASFEAWEPGMDIVYVFEGPDERLIQSDFAECSRGSLNHTFVFSDGPNNGFRAQCT